MRRCTEDRVSRNKHSNSAENETSNKERKKELINNPAAIVCQFAVLCRGATPVSRGDDVQDNLTSNKTKDMETA